MRIKKVFSRQYKDTVIVITRKFHGTILGAISPTNVNDFNVNGVFVWYPVKYSKIDLLILPFLRLFHIDFDIFLEKRKKRQNEKILNLCARYNPKAVYVVQGIQLYPGTIRTIKEKCFIAAGMTDRISLFPELTECLPFYDVLYTYSIEDAKYAKDLGTESVFVPAQGGEFYKPLNLKRNIDLSFVGVMYPERLELLKQLVYDLPDLNIVIYGKYCSRLNFLKNIEWFFDKRLRKCFKNTEISEKATNKLYNTSKICLNLNRSNAGNSWAGRFTSILKTKSFQIMTYNEFAYKAFSDSLALFTNIEELKHKIRFYIDEEQKRIDMVESCYNKYFDESNGYVFSIGKDILKRVREK